MSNRIYSRNDIDDKYKWKLCDIYPDNAAWEHDFKEVTAKNNILAEYKGRVGESAGCLLKCLVLKDEIEEMLSALLAYSRMRRDENNLDGKYQGMADRAADLAAELEAEQAFIEPEIINICDETRARFMSEKPDLNIYRHYFDTLMRKREHTKSDSVERILAMTAPLAESAGEIFGMFNNADIDFGEIEDENNENAKLTHGSFSRFLESRDSRVRKSAFECVYSQYKSHINTLTASFGANIKSNVFYSNARDYPSSLEMFLFEDNIDADVYNGLIDSVGAAIPELMRYLELRKRALCLNELHMYDLYTPIVDDPIGKIPYDDAKSLILNACEPLGRQYTDDLKNALEDGWVDVYESPGKTSGAFSWGSLSAHPFILLNYHDSINDVFTLMHEAGHAMHSYYTNSSQPTVYKNYKIFVAEVASAVNESLLTDYLLKTANDEKKRAFILNYKLDGIRTTVFRQTMFAEFEREIHNKYEKGIPVTADLLCEEYMKLNRKYYSPVTVTDELIAYEWARIPHFYSSFYVYQYATGYSAAAALSKTILRNESGAVDRYLRFLRSGNSDYPLNLLYESGVNLRTRSVIDDTMKLFADTLNELSSIVSA